MGIKKQEFYEGAALHMLPRGGKINSLRYSPPFFTLNDTVAVLMKYSTKGRSPWGFTFTPQEQQLMIAKSADSRLNIALVCGADGVVAFDYAWLLKLISPGGTSVHVACYRDHGEHYRVSGPQGSLEKKISRAHWQKLLNH